MSGALNLLTEQDEARLLARLLAERDEARRLARRYYALLLALKETGGRGALSCVRAADVRECAWLTEGEPAGAGGR